MADTSHDIRTLNSLIASIIDSIDGYTEAATEADNERYVSMFNACATDRRDDQAIINEVERGEDHLKSKWEDALADRDLSQQSRDLIEQCYASVRRGHDQARDLKHALQAG